MSTVKKNVDDAAKRVKGTDQKVGVRPARASKRAVHTHERRDQHAVGRVPGFTLSLHATCKTLGPVPLQCMRGLLKHAWSHVQADKKAAEAARAKELAELFAVAIKQPKVPVGERPSHLIRSLNLKTSACIA